MASSPTPRPSDPADTGAMRHGVWPGVRPDGRLCGCDPCRAGRRCNRCPAERDVTCGHCRGCDYIEHHWCNY